MCARRQIIYIIYNIHVVVVVEINELEVNRNEIALSLIFEWDVDKTVCDVVD